MKRKLSGSILVLVIMILSIGIVGCNQKDNNQNSNSDAIRMDESDNQVTEDSKSEAADTTVLVSESETVTSETEQPKTEGNITSNQNGFYETTTVDGGIKDVYEQYGMLAGTCLSDIMLSQSEFTDLIKENFNSITLENFMKPDAMLNREQSIASGDIVVTFSPRTTNLLDWAKSNHMSARGHVLVWYSQTPDWIFYQDFDKSKGLVDRDTMLARMESYIKQTFELLDTLGYSDMFYAYDVVNEAIMEDGSLRDTLWKSIIGDDYIWYAFYYADKYAPESIQLYYNDYNEQFKTDYIVKMAKSLVDEDGRSLIDGIGCQGHLYTEDSIDDYMKTIEAFSALGLDVQITELDVSLGTWMQIKPATEENLIAQGQYYYELVNRIIGENEAGKTNVSAITYWGFADNLSWRRDRSPMLFDQNLVPKYAYYGAMQDYQNAGF